MSEKKIFDVAVVGAGGAGQMAMLRAALSHLQTAVFLGDAKTTKRGRAAWVMEVDNIPGMFERKRPITSTTREVIAFIEKDESLKPFLTVIKKAAVSVRRDGDLFVIGDGSEETRARFVVLAAGTMDVQPEIGGSIQPILPFANRGDVLYCIRCDGHRTAGHACAVIGHGAGAGWIAVMLKERYGLEKLYVLTHGKKFEAPQEVSELLKQYGIPVIDGAIESVLGDPKKGLQGFKTAGRTVEVSKAFVALGSIVYNDLAKQVGAQLSPRGHIVTDEHGQTSVPGFYAAGDLVEGKKKQVYTAWDLAVDAVDHIDEKIRILKRKGTYQKS